MKPAVVQTAHGGPVMCADAYVSTALTTVPAIEALADEWSRLEQRSDRPCFFQSAIWSLAACRHFAEEEGSAFQPFVVTVRRAGELLAVAPLRIVQRGPVRLAIDLTDPFGQYGDLLIDDACDGEAIVAEVIAALRLRKGVDALLMRRVRADSPIRSVVRYGGFEVDGRDAAPFVDLRPHPTFEGYQKTLNAKTRKNLRNARHRLERIAPVEHRVFSGEGLRGVIEQSIEGRLRWLNEQGLTSTAFDDPSFHAFMARIRELGHGGELSVLAMGLYCGAEPMALQWGFVHRGRYYAYIAARDPGFEDYSVGRLHLEDIISTCHKRGVCIVDFLAPAVRYKLSFTNEATEVVDVALPLSLVGRIVLELWNRRLRTVAKSYYGRLPTWLRRFVRHLVTGSSSSSTAPGKEDEETQGDVS